MIILSCGAIILSIFAGDFWIKNQVEQKRAEGETREILGGRLLLRRYHNRGAALNFGERRRPLVAAVSVLLTLAALGALILSLGQKGNGMLRVGLSLLLGGAFSNTYDRLKRKYVVDYVSFGVKWKKLRQVVFNISDFCIITGALLAVLGAWR
nr:signal peptidase II [uncultured Acetatifactor sp.]